MRQDGVGEPDALERLWTPYRLSYIRGEDENTGADDDECPLCRIGRAGDAGDLVIARGTTVFAVLNLYPYNPGHLMVLPYRHIADLTDLDENETAEVQAMTSQALRAIRTVSSPPAFNIGINLGHVAGGSLAEHFHQHLVPRWPGDANFMTITGGTKTIPQLLHDTRDLLASAWPED